MGTHTYEQTLNLEVARDILNGRIAVLSEQLEIEARRANPDHAAMAAMEDEMLGIGLRIDSLDVRDDASVNMVIEENRLARQDA
ncbi:MAG: hypothetical protein ABW163_03805 [Luteimonas sp.]